MKVLFIGGTGTISSACTQLAVDRGIELTLLTRGQTDRPVPDGVEILTSDIRDKESVKKVLGNRCFDTVVNWVAFITDHIETDLALFKDRTDQYVFISSASVYQTPPENLPVTESTPLSNPFWQYSRDKIACEELLVTNYRDNGFPVTIVRPSHTYDQRLLPVRGGYTAVMRMLKGEKVIVHGDGSSLWTMTHHRDFAKGFIGLLANQHAVGEAFHITSDEILTWNQIVRHIAKAAGAETDIVHIPSDFIATFDPEWGASLLGDKTHSMIFDNSKIKRVVPDFNAVIPFERGAEEIIAWYDANPSYKVVDNKMNQVVDKMIKMYEGAFLKK